MPLIIYCNISYSDNTCKAGMVSQATRNELDVRPVIHFCTRTNEPYP